MKIDPALATVREVREQISREFGNDPTRLIAHYIERQRCYEGRIIPGPESAEPPPNTPLQPPASGRG